MSAWRTALRIAAREARRAKGRSLLVLAMIALPVLALSFAAVNFDMFRLTPEEEIARSIGAADGKLQFISGVVNEQDFRGQGYASTHSETDELPHRTATEVQALLPEGSRAIPYRRGSLKLRTAAGIGELDVRGVDIADPITRGMVELVDGAPPRQPTEVALTRPAAKRLGVGLGGTVVTADDTHRYTVVGIVELPAELREIVVLPPHALPDTDPDRTHVWLVETPQPIDWAQIRELNAKGVVVSSRAVWLDPPPEDEFSAGGGRGGVAAFGTAGLVAGLAVLEVVLLAGPAFAVGARRRRRDLALVAANGGTSAHLRRIVLADGVVLGLAGAVVGIVGGIALAVLARPLVETYLTQSRAGGYRFFPLALAGIAGLAVVTGLLAALVPAFTAARTDVVTSLTGRRGQTRTSRRWLFVGLIGVAAGAGIVGYGAWRVSSATILAGLIIGELGLVLCTPALVGLIARLGRGLPLAPRVALRDIARNRAAAAPAISAVMAAVAGSVALGVYYTADQARHVADYRPSLPHSYVGVSHVIHEPHKPVQLAPPDQVAAAVSSTLPGARIVQLQTPYCAEATDASCGLYPELPKERECPYWELPQPLSRADQRAAAADERCSRTGGYYYGSAIGDVIADRETVGLLTGAHGSDLDRAAEVLAAGGVVVGSDRYLVDGKVTLVVEDGSGRDHKALPRITVPGYVPSTGIRPVNTLISSGALAAAKLTAQPGGLVAIPTNMPSQADQDRLHAALTEIGPISWAVERGPYISKDPFLLVLGIAAGLITLGAAAIATGLAAADGRADLSTLAAVGASPRLRRLLSFSQSGVIAGLGSLLGVTAGLGTAFAVLFAYNQAAVDVWPAAPPYPLTVPWQSLLIVAVVPLVAMLGAGLLTRSRLPIERRLG
ncbi:MAG TPA: FtsX-like permease family protein [Micromonospora sp.]|nr:FtsX-like permease family protein [Micromonospora sp.]